MTEHHPSSLQTLFAEMKRRRVFKVMAVYGAVAFAALQLADLFIEPLGLPVWTMNFLLLIAMVGFPIAVVLAWAFETTPEGVRRTEPARPEEIREIVAAPRRHRWPAGLLALAGMSLLFATGWWMGAGRDAGPGTRATSAISADAASEPSVPAKSVAVLPFADLSRAGDQAWFADGLTEEILNSLAALPELKVTSRTSSFRFRGESRDIRAIADTLGVAHVVEGSVRRFDDELVVTAQLIRAADGSHLMSETYERPADDLFDVQRDVAERVAATLDVFLDQEKRERMFASGTRNVEAFEAFLRGQEVLEAWHAEGSDAIPFDSVTAHFDRAMALDPGYAEAAIGHMDLFGHVLLDGTESDFTPEEAEAQLQRDLAFAATHAASGEARLVAELNRVWLSSDWNRLPGIVEGLREAILAGRNPSAGLGGWTAIILALADSALARRLAAVEREASPLDPVAWSYVAGGEVRAGNTDVALEVIGEARRVVEDHPYLRTDEIAAYANAGRRDSLRAALDRYPWPNPAFEAWRAAVDGDTLTARRLAADLEAGDWPEEWVLFTYRELGDRAAARALARRVDSLAMGPAILYRLVALSAAVPFDLADTPNFRARLAEAKIDLTGLGKGGTAWGKAPG